VSESEPEALASRSERALDLDASGVPSQARQSRAQARRNVDGMPVGERFSRAMRYGSSRTGALAARAATNSSPRAKRELVLAKSTSTRLHEKNCLHT
jgi:hypothetical protein